MNAKLFLPLAAVLCATLLAAGCNRDEAAPVARTEPAADAKPAAPAPPPPPEPAPVMPVDSGMAFSDMDVNKDGALTIDELAATEMLNQHFAMADGDGNGQLSAEEVETHRTQMAPH